jgi:hypothetical protein
MKAKYYAILLKKNKRFLKKVLYDARRSSEVLESLQDSFQGAYRLFDVWDTPMCSVIL